jgi:GT2 family glycosyltransferase
MGDRIHPSDRSSKFPGDRVDAVKTASVVVNWGPPDDAIAALHSLARMNHPPDLIVCVDNGSSAEALFELGDRMPESTILIELGANLGVAAANNAGIAYAISHGAEWTLLLNSDATVDPECMTRCLVEATAAPRIAALGPAVTFAGQPDLLWFAGGDVSDWFAFPRHRGLLASASSPPPTADVGYLATCCALVSSAAFLAVGPFREDYFMYYDDTEWCQRARDAGWRCRYLGEVLCAHAVSASGGRRGSLGLSENMAYYLARNPLRFALETRNPARRVSRVAGILAVYGSFNGWRALKSRRRAVASAYLQGLADAVRGRMGRRQPS